MRHTFAGWVRNVGGDIGREMWEQPVNRVRHDMTKVHCGGILDFLDGRFEYARHLGTDRRLSQLPA
jgi:hypothetical protein